MRYNDPAYEHATNSPEFRVERRSPTSVSIAWNSEDPFDTVDVFTTIHLTTNGNGKVQAHWVWLGRTLFGETNIVITNLWPEARFFKLGTMLDSDTDSLPDAFEVLVSQTNPSKRDSDDDGQSDGYESNALSLPWDLEQDRGNEIVLHTEISKAAEGGSCGRVSVYLPWPAPSNGVVVNYRFGGQAVPVEYIAVPRGNALTIPTGFLTGSIDICAVDNRENAYLDRYVEITLTSAESYRVNTHPARIDILENDLHDVRVFTMPPRLEKPTIQYGTNTGCFYFIRDGDSLVATTVGFSIFGTAVAGVDYMPLPRTITFPANIRTNLLPVIPKFTHDLADKTIILTITNTPGYQIDPESGGGTMTLVFPRD
ncbi:MAG TPA: hypothetical protein VK846_19120 [Candidatus Limnocylindria bacterium]|nr:hypothetical protein [Candidatus Limnocylindria bacterium]